MAASFRQGLSIMTFIAQQ